MPWLPEPDGRLNLDKKRRGHLISDIIAEKISLLARNIHEGQDMITKLLSIDIYVAIFYTFIALARESAF